MVRPVAMFGRPRRPLAGAHLAANQLSGIRRHGTPR